MTELIFVKNYFGDYRRCGSIEYYFHICNEICPFFLGKKNKARRDIEMHKYYPSRVWKHFKRVVTVHLSQCFMPCKCVGMHIISKMAFNILSSQTSVLLCTTYCVIYVNTPSQAYSLYFYTIFSSCSRWSHLGTVKMLQCSIFRLYIWRK